MNNVTNKQVANRLYSAFIRNASDSVTITQAQEFACEIVRSCFEAGEEHQRPQTGSKMPPPTLISGLPLVKKNNAALRVVPKNRIQATSAQRVRAVSTPGVPMSELSDVVVDENGNQVDRHVLAIYTEDEIESLNAWYDSVGRYDPEQEPEDMELEDRRQQWNHAAGYGVAA